MHCLDVRVAFSRGDSAGHKRGIGTVVVTEGLHDVGEASILEEGKPAGVVVVDQCTERLRPNRNRRCQPNPCRQGSASRHRTCRRSKRPRSTWTPRCPLQRRFQGFSPWPDNNGTVRNNQGIDGIPHRTAGRPPATDHGTIERIAFDLFETHGFAQTRTIDIAEAAGISRRTLFRYFATKNDIPWGQFDEGLQDLRAALFQTDPDLPMATALREGIVAFNSFEPAQLGQHVRRMRIIFSTPELQAHAALKYAAWRRVVAEFVAWRLGVPVDAPEPTVAGHVALATSLSAYDLWLRDPDQPLDALIRSCSERSVGIWTV